METKTNKGATTATAKATLGATGATSGATMGATLGATLKRYRKKNDLTQSQLAQRMTELGYPIKHGAISTWENGTAVPNTYQFLALCRILGIQMEECLWTI